MAVDDSGVVDIISIDPSGNVVLTISDHLDWAESVSHQLTLQEKFNRYLAFVESGEILDQYPNAKGRSVIFRLVTKHNPDPDGAQFLERAKKVIESAGFGFQHVRFREPELPA
jgi:hypothetical protein